LSPFLFVADHAGNSMPRSLVRLSVPETECKRHIAWDVGIAAVCRSEGVVLAGRWWHPQGRAKFAAAA
jgi:predicted N-formylglutamate amidohydrolase